MLRLKDIAALMDDCHPRTAKRWWIKLNRECMRMGWPLVGPDVIGHGAHRWKPETAKRLLEMWQDYYSSRGSTLKICRAKYAGDLFDARQLNLNFNVIPQKIKTQKISSKAKTKAVRTRRRTGQG